MAKIPDRMKRRGREPNQEFPHSESLFFRFRNADRDTSEGFNYFHLRLPEQSFNREHPDGFWSDVLLPNYNGWGVGAVFVRDVPTPIERTGNVKNPPAPLDILPWHQPEEENFYHAVLKVFCAGKEQKKVSPTYKTYWRIEITQVIRILKEPDL